MFSGDAAIVPNLTKSAARMFSGRHQSGVQMKRKIAVWVSGLLLLTIGVLGVVNAVTEWSDWQTALQHSVIVASLLYGLSGIVAGIGVLMRRRWGFTFSVLCGLAATWAGTTASMAWAESGQPILSAVVFAAVACVLMMGAISWLAHFATRPDR